MTNLERRKELARSIIAEYYCQSESYRKAICNVLVNERPEIEEGDLIDCKKVEVNEHEEN